MVYKNTHIGKCFTLIPNHSCTMILLCTWFPIEPKDYAGDHGSIGFSRVVFLVEEPGCFGLFLFVFVGRDIARRGWPWMAIPKEEPLKKMGFPFVGGLLSRQKFIWSEDLLFSFLVSFIDRELFCFPSIFSFLLSSDLRSRILHFLFFSFFFTTSEPYNPLTPPPHHGYL